MKLIAGIGLFGVVAVLALLVTGAYFAAKKIGDFGDL